MEVRYYICKHCGNIVEKVKDKGVPVICCGEPMQELKAGVTDAAVEKHVPVYTIEVVDYTSCNSLLCSYIHVSNNVFYFYCIPVIMPAVHGARILS